MVVAGLVVAVMALVAGAVVVMVRVGMAVDMRVRVAEMTAVEDSA